MAWTCSNCGTKNESGLFNFCKKCGSTPSRDPSAGATPPTARSARTEPTRQPNVVQSTWDPHQKRRRRRGSSAFLVVVVLVLLAAGGVVALASRVDIDEALHDLTASDDQGATTFTVNETAVVGEFTDDLFGESVVEDATAVTESTTETVPPQDSAPTTTAPAVAPTLQPLRKRDARCRDRWNGKQNARARRAVVQAADGERLWAGVQLTGGAAGTVQPGVCVIIFGTQPDPTQPALRPGDVYAEAGLASGPRLPFARLGAVSLSYQWNARVGKDGRILPKSAP